VVFPRNGHGQYQGWECLDYVTTVRPMASDRSLEVGVVVLGVGIGVAKTEEGHNADCSPDGDDNEGCTRIVAARKLVDEGPVLYAVAERY